ncbi:PQQ-binding-like beta-propeller repeat protein [Actinoplanes sp. NPDC049802]|uniref:outer membrane protein assembly factor BamB family protein n=1 Tax=Actinoplanes sp. NPDC049802 TaxID=3154742 RepID=UPI0033DD9A86
MPTRLVPLWSAPAPDPVRFNETGPYLFDRDAVIVPDLRPGGFAVHDPVTGAVRRQAAPDAEIRDAPGVRIANLLLFRVGGTPAVLVVHYVSERPGQLLVAQDLATGRRLWHRPVPPAVQSGSGAEVIAPDVAASGGTVLVVRDTDMEGLDALTGQTRWRHTITTPCQIFVRTTPVALLLSTTLPNPPSRCEAEPRTAIYHPDTFAEVASWREQDEGIQSRPPIAADGTSILPITTAGSDTACSALLPDLKRLPSRCLDDPVAIAAHDDRLISVAGAPDDEGGYPAQAWQTDSGRQLWSRRLNLYLGDVLLTSGHRYLVSDPLVGDERWLLPKFISLLDPVDGRMVVLPLDVTYLSTELLGAAAGMIFVRHVTPTGMRLTSYAPVVDGEREPVLGGPTADSWPDACQLLTPDDLDDVAAGYVAEPGRHDLPGVHFPQPNRCLLVPSDLAGVAVEVTVMWVATEPAAAAALLDSEIAVYRDNQAPVVQLGPGVYQVSEYGSSDPTSAIIRVGAVVVHVQIGGHPELVPQVASLVTQSMRGRLGLGP